MSEQTQELDKHELRVFFDKLSKDAGAYDVTIEIVSPELGDQLEAEKLPLAYVAYDDKDDVVIVAVDGKDSPDPVLRHMVEHPVRVVADTISEDTPWAIDVTASDDTQTIVTLHRRAALPPPTE
jgi:hypothetical protein